MALKSKLFNLSGFCWFTKIWGVAPKDWQFATKRDTTQSNPQGLYRFRIFEGWKTHPHPHPSLVLLVWSQVSDVNSTIYDSGCCMGMQSIFLTPPTQWLPTCDHQWLPGSVRTFHCGLHIAAVSPFFYCKYHQKMMQLLNFVWISLHSKKTWLMSPSLEPSPHSWTKHRPSHIIHPENAGVFLDLQNIWRSPGLFKICEGIPVVYPFLLFKSH